LLTLSVEEGEVLSALRQLTSNFGLNRYVVFHGTKTGEELDKIFDESDIALGSLGNHRKGLNSNSAESLVNINKIVEWYEELTHNHPDYSTEMRKYAEEHLSWDAKMKPVIEKIKEIAEEEGKSRP